MGKRKPKKLFDIKNLPEILQTGAVVSQNLRKFCKPVQLYNDLRSQNNPIYLPRSLSYKIKAKAKRKANSDGFEKIITRQGEEVLLKSDAKIIFCYLGPGRKPLRAQAVKNFSCAFCLMKCGDHEGMRYHLLKSHDAFKYKFELDEDDHAIVDVSVKENQPEIDVFQSAEFGKAKYNTFSFCSKRYKQRRRDASNSNKWLTVHFSELGLLNNELPNEKDGQIQSPAQAHAAEHCREILNIPQPEIAQSSEPKVPPSVRRRKRSEGWSKAKRVKGLQSRQFYHSHTYQPMTLSEVMSDADSEDDEANNDDFADVQESLRLNRLAGVGEEDKQFMARWNNFVRKQKVIADGHLPWACQEFTKLYVHELHTSPNFFWWWKFFTIHLWKLGLISPNTIDKCSIILEDSEYAPSTSQNPPKGKNQPPVGS